MEERERKRVRERESESVGGEGEWLRAGEYEEKDFRLGSRKLVKGSSFRVESKSFEVEVEEKKGRLQAIIVERKRGISSWVNLGPESLGFFLDGLRFCIEDMSAGKWERSWKENGRSYSLVRDENKGGCFLRLGVVDPKKKSFSIFIPKGRGVNDGWSSMAETLRSFGVVYERKESLQVEATLLKP